MTHHLFPVVILMPHPPRAALQRKAWGCSPRGPCPSFLHAMAGKPWGGGPHQHLPRHSPPSAPPLLTPAQPTSPLPLPPWLLRRRGWEGTAILSRCHPLNVPLGPALDRGAGLTSGSAGRAGRWLFWFLAPPSALPQALRKRSQQSAWFRTQCVCSVISSSLQPHGL